MIGLITGTLMGLFTQLVLISFYLVESIVLSIAYNNVMPTIAAKFDFELPFPYVSVWFVWGVFILIHFVGRFIGMVIPRLGALTTVNQKNTK